MNATRLSSLSPTLDQATEALGVNLSSSQPFHRYRRAVSQLHGDIQASAILRQLSELQAELRKRQVQGTVTAEDLERLRHGQAEAQSNAVISEYFAAQQGAIDAVRSVNLEISSALGVDFASLARVSGCC